jgi:hypothetical protein
MPAKRSKDRLDLQNSLGGIYVGGYEQKLQDRRNEIKITKNCRDLIEKRPYLIKKTTLSSTSGSIQGWSVQGQTETPGVGVARAPGGWGLG